MRFCMNEKQLCAQLLIAYTVYEYSTEVAQDRVPSGPVRANGFEGGEVSCWVRISLHSHTVQYCGKPREDCWRSNWHHSHAHVHMQSNYLLSLMGKKAVREDKKKHFWSHNVDTEMQTQTGWDGSTNHSDAIRGNETKAIGDCGMPGFSQAGSRQCCFPRLPGRDSRARGIDCSCWVLIGWLGPHPLVLADPCAEHGSRRGAPCFF